jgi:hypothetical protein
MMVALQVDYLPFTWHSQGQPTTLLPSTDGDTSDGADPQRATPSAVFVPVPLGLQFGGGLGRGGF